MEVFLIAVAAWVGLLVPVILMTRLVVRKFGWPWRPLLHKTDG
jgi:hypothetical protein